MQETPLKTSAVSNALIIALIALTASLALLSSGVERALYALVAVILWAASARWSNLYQAVLRLNSRLTQYIDSSDEKLGKFEQRLTDHQGVVEQVKLRLVDLERTIIQPAPVLQGNSPARPSRISVLLLVLGIAAFGFGLGLISSERSNQAELQSILKRARAKSQYAASQKRVAREGSRASLRKINQESVPNQDSYTTILLPSEDPSKLSDSKIISAPVSLPIRSEPYARWKFSDGSLATSPEKPQYPAIPQSQIVPNFGFEKRNVDSSP